MHSVSVELSVLYFWTRAYWCFGMMYWSMGFGVFWGVCMRMLVIPK